MNKIFGMDTVFARFMNTLANVIWIGLLWLIFSLPIITGGAASAAAYYAMVSVVRRKRGYATEEFFKAFKANFKLSLPMQLCVILIFGWLFFDIVYLYGYGTDFAWMLSYILIAFVFVAIAVVLYLYPCLQKFDETNLELFKLAFYFTFRHLFTTIGQLVLLVAAILGVYLMPWSLLIIPGLWWYAESFLVERILLRYGEADPEDEEALEEEDYAAENSVEEDAEELLEETEEENFQEEVSVRRQVSQKKTDKENTTEETDHFIEKDEELHDRLIRKGNEKIEKKFRK